MHSSLPSRWTDLARERARLEEEEREALRELLGQVGMRLLDAEPLPAGGWSLRVAPDGYAQHPESMLSPADADRTTSDLAPLPEGPIPAPAPLPVSPQEPVEFVPDPSEWFLPPLPPMVEQDPTPQKDRVSSAGEPHLSSSLEADPAGAAGLAANTPPTSPEETAPDAQPEDPPLPALVGGVMEQMPESTGALRVVPGSPRENPLKRMAGDPAARARRLARTLVSDVVEYRKADHASALAEGPDALRSTFAPDLEKSRRNFYDQVPERDVPDRERIFVEAVNEILGAGQHVL
jgi:hypothetical protein